MHRALRFLRSGHDTVDQHELMWAASRLRPAERPLFASMSSADQAHSVRVARFVERRLGDLPGGPDDSEWILGAALLHDVGKSLVPLGRTGRALGTVTAWVGLGRVVPGRVPASTRLGRVVEYGRYPELGAELLRTAGSDPRVVAWASEHHRSPGHWSVPVAAAQLLSEADDAS